MKVHFLKCFPAALYCIGVGQKRFELRLNDRNYLVGDVLVLLVWDRDSEKFSGAGLAVRVLSVSEDVAGLRSGYCIMSIELIDSESSYVM